MTVPTPDTVGPQFTQLSDATKPVAAAAGDGDLRLEPGAAANAAKACAQLLNSLTSAKGTLDRVSAVGDVVNGLGAFSADTRLRDERLKPKTVAADGSFEDVLTKHIEAVAALRDLYVAAGKAYQDTEFEGKKQFDTIDFNSLTVETINPDTGGPSGHHIPVVPPK